MKVILKQNYPQLGFVGDTVSVKPGYARNFLFPRGFAVEASSTSAKQTKHVLSGILARRVKLKEEAEQMAKRVSSTNLEFTLKISEGGKSFGSVTTRDIEASLKEKGYVIDRKQVRVIETIKGAGKYNAEIKLHADVTAQISITIKAEGLPETTDTKQDKRAPRARKPKESPVADEAKE